MDLDTLMEYLTCWNWYWKFDCTEEEQLEEKDEITASKEYILKQLDRVKKDLKKMDK